MKLLKKLGFIFAVFCLITPMGCAEELQPAPEFSLESITGSKVSLADSNGKVRIIDFWATWCPPCRKGIPEFVSLYEQYQSQGVEIIGVSLDQGGVEGVKQFAEKMKMNYPVVMGTPELVESFGGVKAIPTAFVVNPKGEIVKKYIGYQPKEVFETDIQEWLPAENKNLSSE